MNNKADIQAYSLKRIFKVDSIILVEWLSIVLVQPILQKVFGFQNTIVGYLDEIFYFLFVVILIRYWNLLVRNKYVKLICISYLIFTVFGIISAFVFSYTRSSSQIAFQFFLDLKLLAFILVFFLYIPSWRAILQFERCVKFALLLGIPFCVFQLLYPSIYDSVFDPEGTRHLFKAGTFELQRLNGLFWHPSLTAFFTAFASFYFIYIVRNRLFAGLALVQLILTFERQEIATFFILIFLTFYMYSNRLYRIRVLLLISTMVAIAISLYYDAIASYLSVALRTTSLNDIASSDEPRIIIYWRGILLAYQHFPFGVGFGNYGGFAAVKYDAVLYHNFHFDQLWWFKDEAFLTDTYYPHIYAEAGIIGFVFYSLSLFCIFKLFYSSVKFPKLRGAIFFCILFLFTVALTAPVLNNPFSLSILGVFLAVIRRINIDKVLQETKLRSANNSGQLSCLALNTDDGKDLKTDAQKA